MLSVRGLCVAAAMAVVLCWATPALATVIVRLYPSDTVVEVGDIFALDIVADIPDLVLGWGLDLTIEDPAILSQAGSPTIGPSWLESGTADGDGLAGIAFPASVSGDGVLLATITLSADAIGQTDLILTVTGGDLTEGFPLDPTGFAVVSFEPGQVTVTPEPAALSLLVLGGIAMGRWSTTLKRSPPT